MDLEFESGRVIRGATEAHILEYLDVDEFSIHSSDELAYLQCAEAKDAPLDYVLEYQDGSLEGHYQALDGPIPLDRVVAAFLKYLRGDPSWRDDFQWERVAIS